MGITKLVAAVVVVAIVAFMVVVEALVVLPCSLKEGTGDDCGVGGDQPVRIEEFVEEWEPRGEPDQCPWTPGLVDHRV